jgi:hypothetical protein
LARAATVKIAFFSVFITIESYERGQSVKPNPLDLALLNALITAVVELGRP